MNAQAVFYQQYEHVRRDEVVGILLALFLAGSAFTISICGARDGAFSICASAGLRFRGCWGSLSAFSWRRACGSSTPFRRLESPRPWDRPDTELRSADQFHGQYAAGGSPIPNQHSPGHWRRAQCQKTNPAGARFCSGCGAAPCSDAPALRTLTKIRYMFAWPERMDSLNCGLVKLRAASRAA